MRARLALAVIVVAGIAPFSGRAVHLDEHLYLQAARAAQTNWLFPQQTPIVFFGTASPDLAAHTHPPVIEYYLAALFWLFGGFSEVPFRLAFSVFAIAAVVAFFDLAQRFTQQPFLVALLFAWSPAFFVYAPTLMMDIPMLAFLLAGFAFYFRHLDGRRRMLVPAAVSFTLAVGTGYTALVPLACLTLTVLLDPLRSLPPKAAGGPAKELLALAAGPLILGLWLIAMTVHFGEFPLARMIDYFLPRRSILHNALATLSFLGGTAAFPWILGWTLRWKPALCIASLGAAAAASFLLPWPSGPQQLWYIVLSSAGLAVLVHGIANCELRIANLWGRSSDQFAIRNSQFAIPFLFLWLLTTLLFFVVIGDLIAVRYLTLVLPPLYLILLREASRRRMIHAAIPTAVLAILIASADLAFVNSHRDGVARVVAAAERRGSRMWGATELGPRFYLERLGVPTLTSQDDRPQPGDLVIRPKWLPDGLFRYSLGERLENNVTVLETFTLGHDFPLQTFNTRAGAGFHSSRTGMTPFAFSRSAFDVLEVTQLRP